MQSHDIHEPHMVGQVYLRKIQDETMPKAQDKIEQRMGERQGA
jgi:hypothetical protein